MSNQTGTIVFNHPAQGAMKMLSLGFKPFPVMPLDKRPLVKEWMDWAKQSNKGMISTYALQEDNCNWGILPALSNHLVLDIDSGYKLKGTKVVKSVGDKSLARLEEEHGALPATFEVSTPSGGRHLYFKGTCRPTQSIIGKGIDTRSTASYVVCPGSICETINEKGVKYEGTYSIVSDIEPAECPEWILELLKRKVEVDKALDNRPAASKLDTESNIAEAMEFLASAPPCVEGDGTHGGEYLLNIFMELRDRGVTQEMAKKLVLQNYNDRCDPPWDFADEEHMLHFNKKLHNAYTYAQNPIGTNTEEARTKAALIDFMDAPLPEIPEGEEAKPLPMLSAQDIEGADIPKRDWVIENMLCGKFISILGAPGGAGKSTLDILRAFSVVTGINFLGDRYPVIKPGAAILYNAEDPLDESMRRVEAARIYCNLTKQQIKNLYLISGRDHGITICSTNLKGEVKFHKKDIETMIATVNSVKAVFLSLDPLVRMHWVNENDNMCVDKIVRGVQRIASKTGCAISLIHHSRKGSAGKSSTDKTNTGGDQDIFRGAGSLLGGMRSAHVIDGMTEEEAQKMGVKPERRAWYFKLLNAKGNMSPPAEFADWYEKDEVEIGNGEKIGVCKRSDINVASEMKRMEEIAACQEEVIEFLRRKIGTGEAVEISELHGKAISCGLSIADANRSRFGDKLRDVLFGVDEFTLTKGNRGAWQVERAGQKQAKKEIDFL